eukprot:gene9123-9883_t
MFCDEYGSKQFAYISYLEKNTTAYGLVPKPPPFMKSVLRAYAEYISLIAPEWIFHIWADPPKDGQPYIFRKSSNQQGGPVLNDGSVLREKYAEALKASGFDGAPYTYMFPVPPLPLFGKKNDDPVRKLYKELEESVSETLKKMNALFGNTHCAKLYSKAPVPYHTQPLEGPNTPNKEFWSAESMVDDRALDFTTIPLSEKSTELVTSRMKEFYEKGVSTFYSCYDFPKFQRIAYYSSIEDYYKKAVNLQIPNTMKRMRCEDN